MTASKVLFLSSSYVFQKNDFIVNFLFWLSLRSRIEGGFSVFFFRSASF